MLAAMTGCESDPQVLAEMAKGKLRGKIPHLAEAGPARWDPCTASTTWPSSTPGRPCGGDGASKGRRRVLNGGRGLLNAQTR
jgi:hypothetical protein